MSPRSRRTEVSPPNDFPAWGLFAALLLVTVVAYYPTWQGGVLWDDDAHLTRVDLRSLQGLGRIWFDVGATQPAKPASSAKRQQSRVGGASSHAKHGQQPPKPALDCGRSG